MMITKIKLLLFVLYPLVIGSLLGYFFKPDAWFRTIQKPSFMPPSIVFQVIWPILYILIGISSYYGYYNLEYTYWILPTIHIITNFMFSPIMFGMHDLFGGFILTLSTLLLALLMIVQYYYTKSFVAIYLIIPYILWLVFATFLAYKTYVLNKKMKLYNLLELFEKYIKIWFIRYM